MRIPEQGCPSWEGPGCRKAPPHPSPVFLSPFETPRRTTSAILTQAGGYVPSCKPQRGIWSEWEREPRWLTGGSTTSCSCSRGVRPIPPSFLLCVYSFVLFLTLSVLNNFTSSFDVISTSYTTTRAKPQLRDFDIKCSKSLIPTPRSRHGKRHHPVSIPATSLPPADLSRDPGLLRRTG